ncbi:Bro-N domain-containing protein [Pseudomonas silvicola]|nr:Bro-N domain-containing protein [Pseudomonas silvicola]
MDAYTATLFFRHNRPLRALMIEGQCWFCLHDLARLLAIPYPERLVRRLDADQHREQWVEASGDWRKRLLVSESGAITLIVRSHIPENRAVRLWLTQEVIPALRESKPGTEPAITAMSWQGGPLSVLYWRDEPWIRLRDMPGVLPREQARSRGRWWALWR